MIVNRCGYISNIFFLFVCFFDVNVVVFIEDREIILKNGNYKVRLKFGMVILYIIFILFFRCCEKGILGYVWFIF